MSRINEDIIITPRDTTSDDLVFCGNNCTNLFGTRTKLKYANGFLHCPECGSRTEVVLSSNNYRKWFKVKNESNVSNVIIISRKPQYLPNSALLADEDELNELRRLKEMYKK